jgi:hypothetical protein
VASARGLRKKKDNKFRSAEGATRRERVNIMNEEHNIHLPPDADDLSKHAPALFALKGTEEGFVVPALYFEELSELVMSKTPLPQDGGLIVPENYFEEAAEQITAMIVLPAEEGLTVPENYFETFAADLESRIAVEQLLPKTEGEIPDGYFGRMNTELSAHIALDNLKQDEGFVVPELYFEKLTGRMTSFSVSAQDDSSVNDDEVPHDYFDSLHDKVAARIASETAEQKGRVIVFSQWKKYASVTAVAASVALLLALAWMFTGTTENGSGSLLVASNNLNFIPEVGVKTNPQPAIDSVPAANLPVADGIAAGTPKKSGGVKPNPASEVIMSDEEIIAQSDLMDESMVMEFAAENGPAETTEDALDPAMMEYLMNDNSGFEIFVPADKK